MPPSAPTGNGSGSNKQRTMPKRQVRTPVLQSFDSSPASIEAFKRGLTGGPDEIDDTSGFMDGPMLHHHHQREHHQYQRQYQHQHQHHQQREDGPDVFGIRIPPAVASGSGTPAGPRRLNMGLFGARPGTGTERTDWARDTAGAVTDGTENEDESELDWTRQDVEEWPSKTTNPVWVRAGGKRPPLGEMVMYDSSPGDLEDTFDADTSSAVAGTAEGDPFDAAAAGIKRRSGGQEKRSWSHSSSEAGGGRVISREYPPSPKKSPIKRLLFGMPPVQGRGLDLDSAYGSVNASQDDAEEEEEEEEEEDSSFLGNMANGFMQRLAKGRRGAGAEPGDEDQDEPGAMPRFERATRPRVRRSLMRRRRTTMVHEDPITSPKLDAASRVTKPEQKRVGSGSSLSTVEAAAVVEAVVNQGGPAMLGRKSLVERNDTPRKTERQRVRVMQQQMWQACGRDMARWNRGDFSSGTVQGLAKSLEVSCRW